jgi:hypothetical protein
MAASRSFWNLIFARLACALTVSSVFFLAASISSSNFLALALYCSILLVIDALSLAWFA